MTAGEIFNDRKNKYLKIGRNKGFIDNLNELSSLRTNENKLKQLFKERKSKFVATSIVIIILISLIIFL